MSKSKTVGNTMRRPLRYISLIFSVPLFVSACTPATVAETGARQKPAPEQTEAAKTESAPEQSVRRIVKTSPRPSQNAALSGLPRYPYGDGVDWVQALQEGQIKPRSDLTGAAEQAVMDADVLIAVKGSMPNVLFPHKAHTEWLGCGNCHVDIYQMQRGVNAVGMVRIAQGESCGVCHDSVAFPLDDCRRCHSQIKESAQSRRSGDSPVAVGTASGEFHG